MQAAIRKIGQLAANAGMPAGIVAGNAIDAKRYLDWGFSFMTVASDVALFRGAVQANFDTICPLRERPA